MWFYSWIRKLSMNSRFIFLFHISFFLFFHVLLGSSYVKTLRGNDNPVTISKPTPQTVVPKHHSPCKGTRATWRKSWFQAGGRKCTVQFSSSVMSDSLWPHGLQHARLPCPSSTPRAYSNSCPSSRWCHLTISSSVVPFSCLQSFLASGSFPMSQFFASGGQSIRVSTSVSVLSMNIQDWFPLGWNGWISVQSKGLSRDFSNITVQKHQFFGTQLSL